jgi:hypothetical protein
MPEHCIITGSFSTVLEDALARDIADAKNADPLAPVVVLVGSNMLGTYLARMLARRGASHVGIRFLTLAGLAKELAASAAHSLTTEEEETAARKVLDGLDADDYFGPIKDRPGFTGAFLATCRDVTSAGLAPGAEIKKALKNFIGGSKKKVREFFRMYEEYYRLCKEHFSAPESTLREAARSAAKFAGVFGADTLHAYGFYDLNAMQKRLIDAVAAHASLKIYFPFNDTTTYDYARPLYEYFKQLGAREEKAAGGEEAGSDLAFLKNRLFNADPSGGEPPGDGTVALIDAPDEATELREVAREMLRLAREENVAFYEMAVLLRSEDVYGPLLAETLRFAGIPFYYQGGVSLMHTQCGRAVEDLLNLTGGGFSRAEVADFIATAPIDFKRTTKGLDEYARPDGWERISRAAGVTGGVDDWLECVAAYREPEINHGDIPREGINYEHGEEKIRVIQTFEYFLTQFFRRFDNLDKKQTWLALTGWLEEFIAEFFLESDEREKVLEIVRGFAGLDKLGGPPGFDGFRTAVLGALETGRVRYGEFERDGVTISTIMPARGISFRAFALPPARGRGARRQAARIR